jgi:hypothetical protein
MDTNFVGRVEESRHGRMRVGGALVLMLLATCRGCICRGGAVCAIVPHWEDGQLVSFNA